MRTRTTLSYPEKKGTLSVECTTQGLSSESKIGKTSEFKFVWHLRAKGKRQQVPRLHEPLESTNTSLLQSLLDALISLKVNLDMAHALPKPPSPGWILSLTGFRLPESEVHILAP